MAMPQMMGAMSDEDSMNAPGPGDQMEHEDTDKEQPHVFFSKQSLPPGVKAMKGMNLRAEVEDVDPETGDVEVCLYKMGDQHEEKQMGYAEAFDKAMPEE